ncbi:phage tail protein [Brevibacillus sp. HB1.1]|uniref:phage tail protein n=1 Tax=Brevibacillus sp. HB1.1 TaxID=2738808 RepID=UPI0015773FAC|nr:phage tail protein [Brevibacillus sp. HB1.1]NTU28841.1 phage tail protein [Brevibacillus sp. HB1.1]
MIDLTQVKLADIIPQNIRNDPNVAAIAAALDQELQAITSAIELLTPYVHIDQLTSEQVDELAWESHVDFYDTSLTIEQKRGLVRESSQWHRRKGTPWAVEQVVSIIFPGAKVAEWYEYGGDPYHFRVETEQAMTEETDLDRLFRIINATKRKSTWLENVTIKRNIEANLYFGGIISEYKRIEIHPVAFKMEDVSSTISMGGVTSILANTTIYPEVR